MSMDVALIPEKILTRSLSNDSLVSRIEKINGGKRRSLRGSEFFQDEAYIWVVYGVAQVPQTNITDRIRLLKTIQKNPTLGDYLKIFDQYFEAKPLKDFDVTVLSKEEEIMPFIESLNRMNAFLFGGIAINNGFMTLEQLAICLIQQQGGIMRPLVNLFDNQALYAKSNENSGRVELVRIATFDANGRGYATIEYMDCYKKV